MHVDYTRRRGMEEETRDREEKNSDVVPVEQ